MSSPENDLKITSNEVPNFSEWFGDGSLTTGRYDIGTVTYSTDGAVVLEIRSATSGPWKALVFGTSLAVRMVQEGSLMEYWRNGLKIVEHNVLVATASSFLNWLEQSSSGVHPAGELKHYAVLSDD